MKLRQESYSHLKLFYSINLTYCSFNLCCDYHNVPAVFSRWAIHFSNVELHRHANNFPPQKLSPSPQQTQGGSVSSPHPSQPSQEESSPCSDMSSYEEPPSPLSAASSGPLAPAQSPAQVPIHRQSSRASDQEGCTRRDPPALCQPFFPNDPTKWNVEEVYEFICSLPGQWCKQKALQLRCVSSVCTRI